MIAVLLANLAANKAEKKRKQRKQIIMMQIMRNISDPFDLDNEAFRRLYRQEQGSSMQKS